MGRAVRSSTKTKMHRRTLPVTQVTTTAGDDHDWSGPSDTPYISSPSPAPPSRNPGRSRRPASMVAVRSRKSAPKITAAMPSGRLTKNTQRHDR